MATPDTSTPILGWDTRVAPNEMRDDGRGVSGAEGPLNLGGERRFHPVYYGNYLWTLYMDYRQYMSDYR